jgi:two-component system response regulator AtoC
VIHSSQEQAIYPDRFLGNHTMAQVPLDPPPAGVIAISHAMRRLLVQIECAAPHLRIATMEGEAGSGKTLLASLLHQRGPAANAPMIKRDAREWLMEATAEPDRFHAGMLYLEDIDLLSLEEQDLLLRSMKRIMEPIPGHPVQLVVSTNRPLRRLVAQGGFMPDLAYRLTAVRFAVPPLRERREEIGPLSQMFVNQFAQKYAKQVRGLGPGALSRLLTHPWPGNIRELASVLEAACLEIEGQWIRAIDLPLTPANAAPVSPAETKPQAAEDLSLEGAVRRHVARVLSLTKGNKLRAASLLGISRSTLYRMMAGDSTLHF